MKKIAFILIAVLLLSCVSAVQTVVTKSDEFRIDLVQSDPSPVQPGETSDLYFEITNLGEETISDFEIDVVQDYPFFIDESSEGVMVGDLVPGVATEFIVPVTVNENVEDGFYTLSLFFDSAKKSAVVSESFTIYVQRVNRIVSATSVSVESSNVDTIPGVLEPGEIGQVTVVIENSANYVMEDVAVKMVLNNSSPFAPIGSSAEKHIRSVSPGKTEQVVFDVIALPDAEAGVYKVDLDLTYYDELGTKYTRNDLIGMVIGGVPEFHIEVDEKSIYSNKKSGDVTLNIVNIGLTNVKFLMATLMESEDYEILSEEKVYLGDVDPDDDEDVTYSLKLKTYSDLVILPLVLEFRDANNVEYSEEIDFEFEVVSDPNKKTPWGTIIFIVVVLGVFYFVFRKKPWFKNIVEKTGIKKISLPKFKKKKK